MTGRILVACIGNIFLRDDAFGVEVGQRLAKRQLGDGVSVVDFGIRSYDLAYSLVQDWDLVILVDALPQGGRPGTLYVFEPELPSENENLNSLDAHTMNPISVLQLVRALGGKMGRLLVMGCEPESVEPDVEGKMGLSAAVEGALDEAVSMIEELVARARKPAIAA